MQDTKENEGTKKGIQNYGRDFSQNVTKSTFWIKKSSFLISNIRQEKLDGM